MKYTELGKTGLHVSEIGFGAWAIGGQAWGNDITDKTPWLHCKRLGSKASTSLTQRTATAMATAKR